MIHFDDDIWEQVRVDSWKYRPRTEVPRLIELHCTRSGIAGRTPLQEYYSTINWSLSPYNRNDRPGDTWASMESFIVGGGKICRVLPNFVWPHYSLGHADPVAFSIEIGQNLLETPFDPRDIDHAAQICAELVRVHNIPVIVLPWLSADNHEGGGFVRHDRSANGSYYGKSDPGPLFDDRAFEEKVRSYLPQGEEEDLVSQALMRVAGAFLFLASDVHQGFRPNENVCNELRSIIGDGSVTPISTRQHAYGLLLYAASEAFRGEGLSESATQLIRYLITARPSF